MYFRFFIQLTQKLDHVAKNRLSIHIERPRFESALQQSALSLPPIGYMTQMQGQKNTWLG